MKEYAAKRKTLIELKRFTASPDTDKPKPKGQNRKASHAKSLRTPKKSLRLGFK
jgi:hypothetical protein